MLEPLLSGRNPRDKSFPWFGSIKSKLMYIKPLIKKHKHRKSNKKWLVYQVTPLLPIKPLGSSWETINWIRVNKTVKQLRGMIFRATKEKNISQISRFQKLLLRSHANLLLSIRKVTIINSGKKTPGIDNQLIKTNKLRWQIFEQLKNLPEDCLIRFVRPVVRILIARPGKKPRPLGIPTIKDRINQNRVKNALEPQWEAQFEDTSYGFRPARGAHDALQRVWLSVARQNKKLWVLDADIEGCFNNISHSCILDNIKDFPYHNIISHWLKAGYIMFPSKFDDAAPEVMDTDTGKGTPQGGIISPLLANIALHGMEQALGIKTVSTTSQKSGANIYSLIRYADDFIVLAQTEQQCKEAKAKMEAFLAARGMQFAPEKVHIRHLSEGLKFLGCSVKLEGIKHKKVIIRAHPTSIATHKAKLKELWLKYKGMAPKNIISTLNPIIRGWANYYSPWVSSKTFSDMDHYMWERAWRYGKRRHPNKNKQWIKDKYFGSSPGTKSNWSFYTTTQNKATIFLLKYSLIKIVRHIIVKNIMCPDDPSSAALAYF